MMELVLLKSPYAGDIERNIEYARMCMKDSFKRGEAPFASHLLYTQEGILNDGVKQERDLGIEAGLEWGKLAELTAVYIDYGITSGMQYGIENAYRNNRAVEFRKIL